MKNSRVRMAEAENQDEWVQMLEEAFPALLIPGLFAPNIQQGINDPNNPDHQPNPLDPFRIGDIELDWDDDVFDTISLWCSTEKIVIMNITGSECKVRMRLLIDEYDEIFDTITAVLEMKVSPHSIGIFCVCELKGKYHITKRLIMQKDSGLYFMSIKSVSHSTQVFIVNQISLTISIGYETESREIEHRVPSLFTQCRATIMSSCSAKKISPYYYNLDKIFAQRVWPVQQKSATAALRFNTFEQEWMYEYPLTMVCKCTHVPPCRDFSVEKLMRLLMFKKFQPTPPPGVVTSYEKSRWYYRKYLR